MEARKMVNFTYPIGNEWNYVAMLSNKDPPPSQGVLSSSQESKRIRE
jgi:hypothetical protein